MMIHEITTQVGRYKTKKRRGRGESSGLGKTSGRGTKGAQSRSGYSHRLGYEGGQVPLARRVPKRGFSNAPFRTLYHIVNLHQLEAAFADKQEVAVGTLVERGIVRDASLPLKVLGEGEITKALHVTAAKFSQSARAKIEAAGGTVTELTKTTWRRLRPEKPKKPPKPKPAKPIDAVAPEAPVKGEKPPKADKPAKGEKQPKGEKQTKPEASEKRTKPPKGQKPKADS